MTTSAPDPRRYAYGASRFAPRGNRLPPAAPLGGTVAIERALLWRLLDRFTRCSCGRAATGRYSYNHISSPMVSVCDREWCHEQRRAELGVEASYRAHKWADDIRAVRVLLGVADEASDHHRHPRCAEEEGER